MKNEIHLQLVGSYRGGLAQGPVWILPPNFRKEEKAVLAHFHQGSIVQDNVILLDMKTQSGIIGRLVNDTYLVDTKTFNEFQTADYNCLRTLKIPENTEKFGKVVKLPVKVAATPETSRIHVRSSKILFFNRVAKTGSQVQ